MSLLLASCDNPHKSMIQRAAVCALFTLVVLFMFQPFGTYSSDISYKYLKLSGYGLATFCAIVLAGMLELFITDRNIAKPYQKWLIGLTYLLLGAILNHAYFAVAVLGTWQWQNQLLFFAFVAAIGLFPVLFIWLVNRHSTALAQVTQHEPSASRATVKADNTDQQPAPSPLQIELQGENKNERLCLSISQLVCIKAADNYCEITMIKQSSVEQILLRTSLNNLLTQFPTDAKVYRCHRSFAVNLDAVKSYSGNASGLTLTTEVPDLYISVSRAYVKDIKSRLSITP